MAITIHMERKITAAASILGILAIILGAFGAHALKTVLAPEQLSAFETGVKYQMYHALFLLFVGMSRQISEKAQKNIYWLTLSGVALFSGSIYLLSTKALTGIDLKPIGIVTPIGGLLLIVAWFWLFIDLIRKKS